MKPTPEEIDAMNEEFDRDQKGEFHIMTAAEVAEWDAPDIPLQLPLFNTLDMNCYGQPRGSRGINGELIWPDVDMDYSSDAAGLYYDEQFKDRDGH